MKKGSRWEPFVFLCPVAGRGIQPGFGRGVPQLPATFIRLTRMEPTVLAPWL